MKMNKYALDDGKKVMERFGVFSLSLSNTSLEILKMNNKEEGGALIINFYSYTYLDKDNGIGQCERGFNNNKHIFESNLMITKDYMQQGRRPEEGATTRSLQYPTQSCFTQMSWIHWN